MTINFAFDTTSTVSRSTIAALSEAFGKAGKTLAVVPCSVTDVMDVVMPVLDYNGNPCRVAAPKLEQAQVIVFQNYDLATTSMQYLVQAMAASPAAYHSSFPSLESVIVL